MAGASGAESLRERGQVVAHIAEIEQAAVSARLVMALVMLVTMMCLPGVTRMVMSMVMVMMLVMCLPVANGSQAVPPLSPRSSLSGATEIFSRPPSVFPLSLRAKEICSFLLCVPPLACQSRQGNSSPPSRGRATDLSSRLFGSSTYPARSPVVRSAPRRSTDAGRGSDELAFLCGFLLLGSGLASLSESIGIRWRNNETLLLESDPEIPAGSDGSLLGRTGSVLPGRIALQLGSKENFRPENCFQLLEKSVRGKTVSQEENTGCQVVPGLERGNAAFLRLESIEPLHLEKTGLVRQVSIGLARLERTGLQRLDNNEFLLLESTGCLQGRIDAPLAQTGTLLHQGNPGTALVDSGNLLQGKTETPLLERILSLVPKETGVVQIRVRIVRQLHLHYCGSGTDPCSPRRGPRLGSECTLNIIFAFSNF